MSNSEVENIENPKSIVSDLGGSGFYKTNVPRECWIKGSGSEFLDPDWVFNHVHKGFLFSLH